MDRERPEQSAQAARPYTYPMIFHANTSHAETHYRTLRERSELEFHHSRPSGDTPLMQKIGHTFVAEVGAHEVVSEPSAFRLAPFPACETLEVVLRTGWGHPSPP
jgi:hypothetical protein